MTNFVCTVCGRTTREVSDLDPDPTGGGLRCSETGPCAQRASAARVKAERAAREVTRFVEMLQSSARARRAVAEAARDPGDDEGQT